MSVPSACVCCLKSACCVFSHCTLPEGPQRGEQAPDDLAAVLLTLVVSLIPYAPQARSGDETVRLTALRWLRDFVGRAKDQLLPQYAAILGALLPNVAHESMDISLVSF